MHITGLGIGVEIVARNPQDKGFVPQPKRWRVEQTYGILIVHRRLVRDYKAMTHVMPRRFTAMNTPTWLAAQAVAA